MPNFFTRKYNLIESIRHINPNISGLHDITEIFLYHQEYCDKTNNTNILDATIIYFIEAKKFDRLLFLVSLNIVAFSTDFDFEMNIYISYIYKYIYIYIYIYIYLFIYSLFNVDVIYLQ